MKFPKTATHVFSHWQQVLQNHWSITATLTRLDGEYDLNFLAGTLHESDDSSQDDESIRNKQDNKGYILKVMRVGCADDFIDLQCRALAHITAHAPTAPVPAVIPANNDAQFIIAADENGDLRLLWLLEKLDGKLYAQFKPHSSGLIHHLGTEIARMDKALADFQHPALQRDFKWNLMQANWIAEHVSVIDSPQRQTLIHDIISDYQAIKPILNTLPIVAIHNDINDYNILVSATLSTPPRISGLIDLGDMCAAPRICELAIAAAYIVLDHPQPEAALVALVQGYHQQYPLIPREVDLLWPLLRMRLAVSVVNSTLMAQESPDDPYVVISQRPAWVFLENNALQNNTLQGETTGSSDSGIKTGLINARLRTACDLPVTDAAPRIMTWLEANRGSFAAIMGEDLNDAPMGSLAVADKAVPLNPFDMPLTEAGNIGQEYYADSSLWLGYYHEPRLVYTAAAFRNGPWRASDRRTIHLAVDAFAPAGTKIYTPLAATVFALENRTDHLDYGGVVILQHATPVGDNFYTLYGHLNPEVCHRLSIGQQLEQGTAFAHLGDISQSGGWAPHTHIQLAMTTEGMGADWPGVAAPDDMYLWRQLCPNPAALLNLPDDKVCYRGPDKSAVLQARQSHFGRNLKLSYRDPLLLVRGWQHHLFDEWGRPYLDAYNNVPHVGHAHPRLQAVAADQLQRINTNTRYLHPAQTELAEKLLSKLPDSLTVCFFVNSGSEANELALRLAQAASGGKAIITPNHGYHGNTTGAIAISAYKFNAPGGVGQADWVHLVDVADDYRGRFRRDDAQCAAHYAAQVDTALNSITARDDTLAGFIAETFPSVGGQIIPPPGYLADVYTRIRAAGGVCIADEVQTGLGRLGHYYFGFEQQEVIPDIVVLGKPLGNGHPIGAVVTTREIAEKFAAGPEYFSTFGGSTLSCRVAKTVLDIVDDEGLMENARVMGDKLLAGLRTLKQKHALIGDVRGFGLFIGVELVTDRVLRTPATAVADYVINRMRERRILLGREGPDDNVLKIRPPLTIAADDVAMILLVFDEILQEAVVINDCG